MNKYKCVGLVGHYWTDNFGDILLRDLMVDYLKNECSIEKVILVNKKDYLSRGNKFSKLIYFLKFAIKADFVIFGGGGYFETKFKSTNNTTVLFTFLLLAIFLRCFFKKYCISGVGAGPNIDGIGGVFIKLICKFSSDITVRDIESKILIKSLGVEKKIHTLADAALIVNTKYKVQTTNKNKITLHLALRDEEYSFLEENLILLINSFPKNLDISLISDHGGIGLEKQLIDKCNRSLNIVELDSANSIIEYLLSCQLVITTKLHIGIVAYSLGVGVFSVYRHPKCLNFYKQINWENYSVPLENFNKNDIANIIRLAKLFNHSIFYDSQIRVKVLDTSKTVYLKVKNLLC